MSGLDDLALRPGDVVRWRRAERTRWDEGRVTGREKDGSVSVRDAKGAARSLPADRLEVRVTGRRGSTTWEPVLERAGRAEQLPLL